MSHSITLIRGDGIGPEIVDAAVRVLDQMQLDFIYEPQLAGTVALEQSGSLLPDETLASIERTDAALKGPLMTPVGSGFGSINVALRKRFDLYANLRPARSFPGVASRYANIDIITVRENTEGAYLADGQTIDEDRTRAESKIVTTRKGCERVVRFACELARREGRKKITAIHKANILKTTSGLFLEVAQAVAGEYPELAFNDLIIDNACMQLVMNPYQFDVIVTTNLFGDITSDLCAGLIGGLGMAPGANIGDKAAIFEAVHGSAPDIAGKGIANPCAVLLAAAQMLSYLELEQQAARLRAAIGQTIEARDHVTPDLGGESSTDKFTDAIISRL